MINSQCYPGFLQRQSQFRAYVALAAVCFFWGTTYLGIRIALEWVHPLQLMCLRYLLSGAPMLAVAFFTKARLPERRELLYTSLFGVITIGMGTGTLAFAELWIPSGLAALIVSMQPFWMVSVEALIPGGDRLHAPTVVGMLVGIAGTALLVGPSAIQQGLTGAVFRSFLILQIGACGWSLGSILHRRQNARSHPVISAALQQLATGLFFLGPAIVELRPHPLVWRWRGAGAILYLAVIGGAVGYTAYIYALTKLPVSIASIYTYVNPIVALWLGWLFYREPIGPREIIAMIVIFAGVALVRRFSRQAAARLPQAAKAQTN
ncbi:MAG TPA: EamA family transporter [Bryobacteraceae bacterium]|nr:EamA family transporter [Bryobacteraceae bacterium]